MKTLIVYYSFTGNNQALAFKLRERLQCDILRIEETGGRTGLSILLDLIFKRRSKLKKYNVQLKDFDNIVLVAPVWAGAIGTPMQAFLQQEKQNIRQYSFITVCSGAPGQREKISGALQSIVGVKPSLVEELWVNDLLPAEKKNKIRYTTPYRVKDGDWRVFNPKLAHFVNALNVITPETI